MHAFVCVRAHEREGFQKENGINGSYDSIVPQWVLMQQKGQGYITLMENLCAIKVKSPDSGESLGFDLRVNTKD